LQEHSLSLAHEKQQSQKLLEEERERLSTQLKEVSEALAPL